MHTNLNLKLEKFEVLFDEVNEEIYCYDKTAPTVELYKINSDNGILERSILLEEVRFPKQISIFNGWLYFVKINDAKFNKLYRVKIKNESN